MQQSERSLNGANEGRHREVGRTDRGNDHIMRAPGPPPAAVDRPELLTAAWLSQALQAAGHDVEVDAVTFTAVGTGQMGSSYRLELEHRSPTFPTSLVAKLPSDDPETRATIASAYRAEAGFYTDLTSTVRVRVPGCYGVVTNDDCSVFVLLMEDLAPASQGDQFAGADADAALASVINLAGLHGPRWGEQALAELDFLSFTEPDVAEFLGDLMVSATETFLERFQGAISDDDAAVLVDAAALSGRFLAGRPERFSVIHGDYRMDNLLFAPDGTVTAVDWQTVALGLPGRDLAYFCSTSLAVDERRAREHELVAAYHAALVDHGVEDHPLDECFDDYRYGMLHAPMIIVLGATYGATTERGDRMFLTMLERSCAAIRDHATLDLVRADTPS